MKKKISFEEFSKKALLPNDELMTVLTLDPISTRLMYFVYKHDIKITPNQISYTRLLLLAPLSILFFFLAPLLNNKLFYLFGAIIVYLVMLSDDMDGHLARGSDQRSQFGAFLDSISDRVLMILFITFLFSVGMFMHNSILIYGTFFLFALKMFNLVVINKVYYYGAGGITNEDLFSADKELKLLGMNKARTSLFHFFKFLNIKRNGGNLGGYERIIITIIIPSLFVFFGWGKVSLIICLIFMILYSLFYISRTANLLKDYKRQISSRTSKK